MPDDKDIEDVRLGEQRRSKRPIDIDALRRRFILQKKFKEALECDDIEKFKEAIISDLGQLPGSEAYENSLGIWNEMHSET